MKMIEYLYYGMLLISIVLIYFAMRQYNGTKELLGNGIKTKAKVVDLIEFSDEDGSTYKPVFEFVDMYKNVISFESQIRSRPAPYKIGDKVSIIYSKDTDEIKIVSFWGLYRWTIILLSIASPLLIIGGGYIIYSK